MKLRTKLLLTGCVLTALPLLVVGAVTYTQNGTMRSTAEEESMRSALADLDHIAQGIYALVASHQEVNEKNVSNALNVARDVLRSAGRVDFCSATAYPGANATPRFPHLSS